VGWHRFEKLEATRLQLASNGLIAAYMEHGFTRSSASFLAGCCWFGISLKTSEVHGLQGYIKLLHVLLSSQSWLVRYLAAAVLHLTSLLAEGTLKSVPDGDRLWLKVQFPKRRLQIWV
jgi:hypothetical protein